MATGLLLGGANPKNLAISAGAAITIGTSYLNPAEVVWAIAIFTVIASSTVIVPVVAFAFAAHRLDTPLRSLEEWLLRNNTVMMGTLMLIFGFVLIGNGIGSF